MPRDYPSRIVCLTEETTETLYLLGEEDRIVGISGFTVRPPRARREKPRVSAFTSAKIDRIVDLKPDLVLGFSDLQSDIARDLVSAGIEVHVFNHRSVSGILQMIAMLGGFPHKRVKRLLVGTVYGEKLAGAGQSQRLRKTIRFFKCDDKLFDDTLTQMRALLGKPVLELET